MAVEARGAPGAAARRKAKEAAVGAAARVLFYPTLLYNVVRNKVQAEFRWWDEVDQFILLGAVPFRRDVPRLQKLGVHGVITLNEPFETLVPASMKCILWEDNIYSLQSWKGPEYNCCLVLSGKFDYPPSVVQEFSKRNAELPAATGESVTEADLDGNNVPEVITVDESLSCRKATPSSRPKIKMLSCLFPSQI
ncbi:hypothetical protein PR202_gb17870 [Eleusine coracana subsp. coracana]|uniref:Dual specificity protein phosphatase DSP8 n=1 Tax=Eleusine coracana subsp. coracana TaxID=191504 RepID=A0AAV5F5M0_ELECO|nr:hypothetical protein PR202_gb17870 [Eleusine coracana subsp. coracana]